MEFLVPEAIEVALAKHAEALMTRAGCTRQEWDRRVSDLFRHVHIIPTKAADPYLDSPQVVAVRKADPEDAVYVASMLATGAEFLWTRDAILLRLLPSRAVTVVP